MMNETMIIEITDYVRSESRSLKPGTTKKRAKELLHSLWEDDYLGLVYRLWVDGEVVLELGA